ncbi:hypothetical protein GFS60_06239 (plasmid) [Rhodococcus sp. WAY2]|nr:hypothetical protein GFS60_06239 [Rhodococcus sp. WAY2]
MLLAPNTVASTPSPLTNTPVPSAAAATGAAAITDRVSGEHIDRDIAAVRILSVPDIVEQSAHSNPRLDGRRCNRSVHETRCLPIPPTSNPATPPAALGSVDSGSGC